MVGLPAWIWRCRVIPIFISLVPLQTTAHERGEKGPATTRARLTQVNQRRNKRRPDKRPQRRSSLRTRDRRAPLAESISRPITKGNSKVRNDSPSAEPEDEEGDLEAELGPDAVGLGSGEGCDVGVRQEDPGQQRREDVEPVAAVAREDGDGVGG